MSEDKFWDDLAAGRRPDEEEEKFWNELGGSEFSKLKYRNAEDVDDWQITKGVKQGYQQLEGFGGGTVGLLGDIIGSDQMRDAGYASYLRNMDEADVYRGNVTSYKDVNSIEDAVDFALHGVGTLLPMFAPSILSGGVGAQVGKKFLQGTIQKKVGELTAKGVAEKEALRQAANSAAKMGAATGAFASSLNMQSGMIYGDVREETGESRPDVALSFGAITAALDSVPIFKFIDRIGIGKDVKKEIAGELKESLGTFIGKQMLAEGGTEMLQTIGEQAAIAWVDENRQMFTEDDWEEIINAGILGALGGGTLGALGGRGDPQQNVDDNGNPLPPDGVVPIADDPNDNLPPTPPAGAVPIADDPNDNLPPATEEQLAGLGVPPAEQPPAPPSPAPPPVVDPLQAELEGDDALPPPPGGDALDAQAGSTAADTLPPAPPGGDALTGTLDTPEAEPLEVDVIGDVEFIYGKSPDTDILSETEDGAIKVYEFSQMDGGIKYGLEIDGKRKLDFDGRPYLYSSYETAAKQGAKEFKKREAEAKVKEKEDAQATTKIETATEPKQPTEQSAGTPEVVETAPVPDSPTETDQAIIPDDAPEWVTPENEIKDGPGLYTNNDDSDTYATSADGNVEVRLVPETLQEAEIKYEVYEGSKLTYEAAPLEQAVSDASRMVAPKPETKTETKPETKTETKTETKPETKTETKTETKPKAEADPELQKKYSLDTFGNITGSMKLSSHKEAAEKMLGMYLGSPVDTTRTTLAADPEMESSIKELMKDGFSSAGQAIRNIDMMMYAPDKYTVKDFDIALTRLVKGLNKLPNAPAVLASMPSSLITKNNVLNAKAKSPVEKTPEPEVVLPKSYKDVDVEIPAMKDGKSIKVVGNAGKYVEQQERKAPALKSLLRCLYG